MKFGVFYELQLPRPWNADSEYNLYRNGDHDVLIAGIAGKPRPAGEEVPGDEEVSVAGFPVLASAMGAPPSSS